MAVTDDLEQRLAFLNLGDADREHLGNLRELLEKNADTIVSGFYRHLLSFQPTRELLREPAVKERLLNKQREYLIGLSDPAFDEEFERERRHIGEVHERIGLEPRWYLGAYSLYFSLLAPLVYEEFSPDHQTALGHLISLQKLLTLDSELAVETYIDRKQSELEYLADELATEGRRLAEDYQSQQVELRRTTDRAQAAEELASVATLVAGLAHEIGTPMGVIQGHAKLLEGAVQGDDAVWRLRTIQEQIGRISKIIQTLLNMARPRRTRRLPVELGALIESSLSFVQEKLGARKIEIDKEIAAGGSVLGDAERLQQLFLNLFLNAADAMADGGRLSVRLEVDGDADEVCVVVRDSGHGISPDDVENIFAPFFTTKPAGEGSGLGLMVAHGIVKDHGGVIEVDSQVGEGTRFALRFPVLKPGDVSFSV
jgi:signal transduction histidine kinase